MDNDNRTGFSKALATFTETFGLSQAAAASVLLFAGVVIVAGVFWFVHSAPPRTLTITSGPPGSAFYKAATNYARILSSNGVTLKVLTSMGSADNMSRLANPGSGVDIGFVQGGETNAGSAAKLYSLGSVSYQPLLIFYRSAERIDLLSNFTGKKLALGPPGSGTRALALALLETNGISTGGRTEFLDLDPEEAPKALLASNVDAVFLMGDSASSQTMRTLSRAPGIQLFDFVQADAYTRRFPYLNKLVLPRGSIDFGKDVPSRDVNLVGPSVELVARSSLHPALSDLLIEAAQETHGGANLLQHRGEFPAPLEHQFKISPDASRYYKSGKTFLYRYMPFWLASLVNRVLVAFVPMALVLIPSLRLVPSLFKWQTQIRIYRWYRGLLRVERELVVGTSDRQREDLRQRLDQIEKAVNQMKVPASFANQFYGLREHIGFVRDQMGQR